MEIYKTVHGTRIVEGAKTLRSLQYDINAIINELEEDKKLLRMKIVGVSIATYPNHDTGGRYAEWNAIITYSYEKPNVERR